MQKVCRIVAWAPVSNKYCSYGDIIAPCCHAAGIWECCQLKLNSPQAMSHGPFNESVQTGLLSRKSEKGAVLFHSGIVGVPDFRLVEMLLAPLAQ